jgi:hypothetical protein
MTTGLLESADSSRIAFIRPAPDQVALCCPACAREVVVPAAWGGGKTRCRVCRSRVKIPRRAGDMRAFRGSAPPVALPPWALEPDVTPTPVRRAEVATRRVARAERHVHEQAREGLRRLSARSQRNVTHERHLRALGVLYGEGTVFTLGGSLLLLVAFGVSPVFLLFAGLAALQAGVCYGLWTYQNWARLGAAALAVLSLVLTWVGVAQQPVGMSLLWAGAQTVWGGAVVWALLGYGGLCLCNLDYRELVRSTPEVGVHWWSSPFFWVPHLPLALSLVALLFSDSLRLLVRGLLGL